MQICFPNLKAFVFPLTASCISARKGSMVFLQPFINSIQNSGFQKLKITLVCLLGNELRPLRSSLILRSSSMALVNQITTILDFTANENWAVQKMITILEF